MREKIPPAPAASNGRPKRLLFRSEQGVIYKIALEERATAERAAWKQIAEE